MAAPASFQSDQVESSPSQGVAISFAAALFTFAVCYFRSFIFPSIAILPSGDQIGFAYSGSRIVSGHLPYRDYFQIVPPGADLAYAALVKLFGLHTWTPQLVMAVLAAMAGLLVTLISARVLRGMAVVLPAIFLVGFLLPESLDGTHHWFSTVAALAALLAMLDADTSLRIAAAGAGCGLTACFTQTKGAAILIAFVVYLIWMARQQHLPSRVWLRQCGILCAGAASIFIAANVYFILAVGVRGWLYCVIVFPLRYYPVPAINNWRVVAHDFGWHGGLSRWVAYPFAYATVPLAGIAFLLMTRRRWKDHTESWPQLVLIALTAVFMFLAVAPSPSLKRLGSAGPPAMIPLVWLLSRPGKAISVLKMGLTLAAIGIAVLMPLRAQMRWHAFLDLPAGRTAFQDKPQYDEYRWVLEHTHPGQFFYGLPMYLPFRLVNPAYIDGMDASDYTRPEQVTELVRALDAPVPIMILPSSQKYPRDIALPGNHLGSFREYLCRNYKLTQTLAAGDEVWQRRVTPVDCVSE